MKIPDPIKYVANNDVQKTFIRNTNSNMEDFEIEVATGGSSITYTVTPLEDGKFEVKQGDDLVGTVYPNTKEQGTTWYTDDDIDDDLLENIGTAIQAEKM
jgi:hypothetical protein